MASDQKLKTVLLEMLANGIEVDTGKQRFRLSTLDGQAKSRGGRRRRPIVLKAVKVAQPSSGVRRRTADDLKVDPNGILQVLETRRSGMRMREIAGELGVAWQGLIASLRYLKRRHKVSEANGFYFLAGTVPEILPTPVRAARPVRRKKPARPRVSAAARKRRAAATAAKSAAKAAARRRDDKRCTYEECERDHYAKGLCNNHYNIERRRAAASSEFDPEAEMRRRKAYRLTILNALREQQGGITLYDLGKVVKEKWQTLRQPASELVRDRLIVKKGKLYMPKGGVSLEEGERL